MFVLQAETCIISSLCVGAMVRLVLGGVGFEGWSLHSQFVVSSSLVRLVMGGVRFAG